MNVVIRSIRAFFLTTLLLCNQLVVPSLVYAQDASASARPAPSVTPSPTPTPTTSPSPIPTPTPTPVPTSSTTTGNASAQGSSSTTANTTNTTVSGSVSPNGCSVSGSTGCLIDGSNTASVSGSTTATGSSGSNSTTNSTGNGVITTGTASGSAVVLNALNTTVITASSSGLPTATGAAERVASPSGTPSGGSVTLSGEANLAAVARATGVSGQNSANNNGNNAGIKTGDSAASVAVANMLNTTVIGSNVKFVVINITADERGNINLLQSWKEIEAATLGKGTGDGKLDISLTHTATSSAILGATAVSGDNQTNGNGGDAVVLTGNAFASASLINLLNTNIIGSQFLFPIINIFHSLTGDIIVPNASRFFEVTPNVGSSSAHPSVGETTIDNTASLGASTASASADSGTNRQLRNGGGELLTTGQALAHATTTSLLNTTLVGTDWFRILLNNFGSWNGGISGWSTPDGLDAVAPLSSTQFLLPTATVSGTPSSGGGSLSIGNTATSQYEVTATARSGGNEANDNQGNTTIRTGTSVALANVFQMLNTTVIGSRFFFPLINIFGTWNGNLAVAYPNLHVGLMGSSDVVHPGASLQYTVTFANTGYEEARDAKVRIDLPPELVYLGNSRGVSPEISGSSLIFPLGVIGSHASGSFTITVQVNSQVAHAREPETSLLTKLTRIVVPRVYAAGNERTFVVTAAIVTSDVAQGTKDNTASVTTTVAIPETPITSTPPAPPSGSPTLTITSSHNVGRYVYQKDTITFSVQVTNTGTATAQDVHSQQLITDSQGKPLARVMLSLGTIPAGGVKKLTFGLKVPPHIAAGLYTSEIAAVGVSEVDGQSVHSPLSRTTFLVRELFSRVVPPALAAESAPAKPGDVLGAQTIAPPGACQSPWDMKPYALAALLTILFGIELVRRKRIEDVLRWKLRAKGAKK